MSEPVQVNPARFFEFIARPGLVVVFLSFHPLHPFNYALARRVRDENDGDVPVGIVGLVDLLVAAPPALSFIQQGLRACGVSRVFDVMPGYYLFRHGRMLAWESGLPSRGDVATIVRGSVLGAVVYAFTKNVVFLGKALRFATEEAIAQRLTLRFLEAADHRRAPNAAPPPPPSAADELMRAFELLGVPPTATDRDVNMAWRRLRLEVHPDRAADDPVEFARRSRLSTEINRAREIIRNHRERARHRPTG